MGASRDFTTGHDTGVLTAVRGDSASARGQRSRDGFTGDSRGGSVDTAPQRWRTPFAPEVPQTEGPRRSKPRTSRVGSRQIVSYRGYRQIAPKKATLFTRLSAVAIAMLICGLALAMYLSGMATTQTFAIQRLTVQEEQLTNQLESLNRDLENVRSSADVARQAAATQLGVPTHPGIVEVDDKGVPHEKRAPEDGIETIFDINGAPVRPGQASSNPDETRDVSGSLTERPQGQQREYERNRNGAERAGADNEQAPAAGEAADAQNNAPANGEAPAPAPEAAPQPNQPIRAPYSASGQ